MNSRIVSLACRVVFAGQLLLTCSAARAVIVTSGNGNTTAASLLAAGGPGDPSLPGFANVGTTNSPADTSSGASVVYLQDRWVITAGHVSLGSNVYFDGNPYAIQGSATTLLNDDGITPTDLKLFRLATDPGLPAITSSYLTSATPSGRQILIGNGLNTGTLHYWHVDTSVLPWAWTDQSPPAVPGVDDYAGYDVTGGHIVRWGENNVLNLNVNLITMTIKVLGYNTAFDNDDYTHVTPLASEAHGTSGDSGGAVFALAGDQWVLGGIMYGVSGRYSGQPSSTAIFGDRTLIVDLSKYRSQILAVVPEPSSFVLAAVAAAGLAAVGGRLRRRRR